jgi:4,5-dihydroxyphthalate decarboxylase
LRASDMVEQDATDRLYRRVLELGAEPLPYGIEPHRAMLENLVAHARRQRIVRRAVDIDSLFATGTRDLTG